MGYEFERKFDAKLVLSVLASALMTFTGIVVETSMNVTFPTLMREFQIGTGLVQWCTTGYLFIALCFVCLVFAINQSAILGWVHPLVRDPVCADRARHRFRTAKLRTDLQRFKYTSGRKPSAAGMRICGHPESVCRKTIRQKRRCKADQGDIHLLHHRACVVFSFAGERHKI